MIKASFGGGGRGMRVVHGPDELESKLAEAQREAGAAFGRPDVFLERYIARAKHIEVQILGDAHGNLVHLWERDCSVQRRHQKVVEVAPSINLSDDLRESHLRGRRDAVPLGRLSQRRHRRVPARSSIAASSSSSRSTRASRSNTRSPRWSPASTSSAARSWSPPATSCTSRRISIPAQETVERRGVAMQCRVTTEDPDRHFIPDYGRITTYRSAGGFAVRLDGGNGFGGAVITPYFDSLLVKVTTWGGTLEEAVQRADRALREFRIRGVKTNIPFLLNLIGHPDLQVGRRDDDVHRRHAGALSIPRAARPRHEDALVSRRRHRQRPAGRQGVARAAAQAARADRAAGSAR